MSCAQGPVYGTLNISLKRSLNFEVIKIQKHLQGFRQGEVKEKSIKKKRE